MMKGKSKILLLLISTLCLISLVGFNYVAKQNSNYENKINSDFAKSDSLFQALVNVYCKAKSEKNLTEEKIRRLNDSIAFEKFEIENKKKLKENILLKSQTESMKLQSDTPKKANRSDKKEKKERKKNKDQEKTTALDSIVKNIENEIIKIDSRIKLSENEIKNLQNEIPELKKSVAAAAKEIRRAASKIEGSLSFNLCGVRYHVFVADLDSCIIRMHLFKKKQQNFFSLGEVKEFLEKKKLEPLMITNAGMFTPSYEPEGLYIEEDSKTKYELDTTKKNTDENFYLYPNGVFFIDSNNEAHVDTTESFERLQKEGKYKVKLATQSGPMLVINGAIHRKFVNGSSNAKIRSGVGVINNKKVVFAITINESNFYDFAFSFKEFFNCKDALFLDGAISKMYLKDRSPEVPGGNFGPMISVSKNQKTLR